LGFSKPSVEIGLVTQLQIQLAIALTLRLLHDVRVKAVLTMIPTLDPKNVASGKRLEFGVAHLRQHEDIVWNQGDHFSRA
jgi:hypothetical protein